MRIDESGTALRSLETELCPGVFDDCGVARLASHAVKRCAGEIQSVDRAFVTYDVEVARVIGAE